MTFRNLFLLSLTAVYSIFNQIAGQAPQVVTPHASPALRFTENAGQWESNILFRSNLGGGTLFMERDGMTFSFYDSKKLTELHQGGIAKGTIKDLNLACHAYKVLFVNHNPGFSIEKKQQGADYENFYLGNDQSKWKSSVRNYHQIFYRNIFAGIDYEVLTAVKGMKYNFHVKPGANTADIQLRYEGVDHIKLKNGVLYLKLSVNGVTEQRPYAYQLVNGEVKTVACRYTLKGKTLGFEFPDGYNKDYELVIDPLLVFAASSGSNADNFGMTATYDVQGNLYAGGTCFNNGYPVTLGAFSLTFSGTPNGVRTDVVITKYNSTGNQLLFSTYIGGSQSEIVTSLVVDNSNNLCFYGATGSADFPMLSNSFDPIFNGGQTLNFFMNGTFFAVGTDIYLAKFNNSGTSLLASTFLGGSGNDGINHVNHVSTILINNTFTVSEFWIDSLQFNYGDQYRGEIQVDVANNIYIASSTRSGNFPTANAFDVSLGGKQDAVVCKFNSSLSNLLFSTYLGGSENDCGNALIVRNNGEVYVTGGTISSDFPTTAGSFTQTFNGGIADGFITHINSSGNGILQSTYLGTSSYDQPYFIQTDKYDQIYVYGQSLGNMTVQAAPNETVVFNVPGTHQFITRFNSTLSNINLSTVFGNYTSDIDVSPCAFAVDKCLNIYVSGWGGNVIFSNAAPLQNMPLFQATQANTTGFDFYFMGLDSNAKALKYGSYYGGATSREHVDGGTSRFDPSGKIYQSACAGCGGNDDWPVTPGAWPNTPGNQNHNTNCNNGVVKLDFQLQTSIATIHTNTMAGCAPFAATFTSATPPTGTGATFTWYLAPGVTNSTNANPSITYTAPGVYTVALVVRDNLTCNKKDSTVTFITIHPSPVAQINITATGCSKVIQVSNTSTGNLGNNPHFWNFGSGTSTLSSTSFTYPANGNYNVTYTVTDNLGCKSIASQTVGIFDFQPGAVTSASLCSGKNATLQATGGTSYTWSPATNINNPNAASPVVSPNATTNYTVLVKNNTPGYDCTVSLVTQVVVFNNPIPSFSLSTSPCSNTIVAFNFSSGNLGSNPFIWNFGNGSPVVSSPAPTYTYPANGTYTVSLIVTDNNGCQSVQNKTISVFNFTPGVVSSSSLCYGNTTTLTAGGGTSYSWTPGAGLSSTLAGNPSASPSVTTIYTVVIENNTPGYSCSKTLTTEITVRPTPTANFAFSVNPCGGGVNFTDQSADDIATWNWTLTPTRTSTVQHPYNFYQTGGTYTITLVTKNIYGCPNTIQKEVGVPSPPKLTVGADTAICIGQKTQLNASGGVSYDWSPPQTLDVPTIANPVATPKATTEYSVNITTSQVVNGNVCKFILTTLVKVDVLSNVPISAVADPVLVTVGDPSTLRYVGEPGANVKWLPDGSTKPTTGYTVVTYPERPTTYTAVANRGACTTEVEVHVDAFTEGCEVKDFFVPNTFSPNGDGVNDILYLRGIKAGEMYFAVYDRWGELVFETKDISKGWDGKFKGRESDVGVFGWYFKAKCINGGETFAKGNVTLIR